MDDRRKIAGFFLLAALLFALAAHGRSLTADFAWDDDLLIRRSPCLTQPFDARTIFAADLGVCVTGAESSGYWRPLQTTVFYLLMHVGGGKPFPFHLANLFLHLLAVWGVWRLGRSLRFPTVAAGTAALLFDLATAHVEQIALAANLGGLLAVALMLHALAYVGVEKQSRIIALGLLFAAALATKEEAVVLPFAAGWLALTAPSAEPRRKRLFALLPLFFLLVFYAAWRLLGPVSLPLKAQTTMWFAFPDQLVALGYYLVRTISPLPGNPDLSALAGAWKGGCAQSAAIAYLFVGIAAIALLVCLLRKGGLARLLAGLFVLAYLPYAGLLPLYTPLADHYIYFASVPVYLGLGLIVTRLPQKARWMTTAILATALLSGSIVAHGHWRNDESLWRYASQVRCPGYKALDNQAAVMLYQGKALEAQSLLERSVAIAPFPTAERFASLGSVLLLRGRYEDAARRFTAALAIDAKSKRALSGMATAYLKKNKPDKALEYLKIALAEYPADAGLWSNKGVALAKMGRYAEAREAFAKALSINPNMSGTRQALDELPAQP